MSFGEQFDAATDGTTGSSSSSQSQAGSQLLGLSQGQMPGQMQSQSSGRESASPSATASVDRSFGYQPPPGVWDEMMSPSGQIRPTWARFMSQLQPTDTTAWSAHQLTVQRLLREHGVTYNVYQDSGAAVRPWELDIMPVLLSAAEFAPLEQGLQQRLRLFRAILQDIYGPQRSVREGIIPARLLYANPSFLRGAMSAYPSEGHLFYLGTNVVRLADGSWRVLSDRAQMPSGLGYSLENRIIGSQVLSSQMKQCRVQRLAAFFEQERNSLRDMAPLSRGTPHVVMLTSGPSDRSYFEHAFKIGRAHV